MLPHRPDLGPLPDPPEVAPASRWRSVLSAVGFGLAGAAVGYAIVQLTDGLDGLDVGAVGLALALTVGVFAVFAVHELGHVAGGQLAGFRFQLFIAGPLRVERTPEGLAWGLNRSVALGGGLALSLPTDDRDLRRRMAMVVAGGPLASAVLGGVGLALGGAWAIVGMLSLLILAATLWPGTTSGFLTDGARLIRLARGGVEAEREAALLAVFARAMAGARPRDWDPGLLATARRGDADDPMAEAALALVTAHAFDTGDADAAYESLAQRVALWETAPPSLRGGLATDAAVFEAVVREDAARARAWIDRVPPRALLADPGGVALAEAAALRAEGDLDGAREHADAVRTAQDDALDAGTANARVAWVDALGL